MNKPHTKLILSLDDLETASGGKGDWMMDVVQSHSQAHAAGIQTGRTPMVDSPAPAGPRSANNAVTSAPRDWSPQIGQAIDSLWGKQ